MSREQPDPRFPITDSPNIEPEVEVWMSVSEAAKYGSMSPSRIYTAMDNGLQWRTNPVSNVKEISRDALERWFCPFKGNAQYEDEKTEAKASKQRMRIRHLQTRLEMFRSHTFDLQDIIGVLKAELETAHEKERKLLEIIANQQKK